MGRRRKMKQAVKIILFLGLIPLLLYAKYEREHRFIPEEVEDEIIPVGDVVITDQDTTIYIDDMPVHIIIK
jgi:hypothetical protein